MILRPAETFLSDSILLRDIEHMLDRFIYLFVTFFGLCDSYGVSEVSDAG